MTDEQTALKAVDSYIERYLHDIAAELNLSGGQDVLSYIRNYTERKGKRLRPRLLLHMAGSRKVTDPVLRIASATEILHLFALMHDDRIDRTERVQPTGVNQAEGDYDALRLLGGDFLHVCGMQLLGQTVADHGLSRQIIPLVQKISLITIAGQADDLSYISRSTHQLNLQSLYQLYDAKTGYYTFVAPVQIGYLLSESYTGHDDRVVRETLERLRVFGLSLGRHFQMRDDEHDILHARNDDMQNLRDVPHWEYNLLVTWLHETGEAVDPLSFLEREHRRDYLSTVYVEGFRGWCRTRRTEIEEEIRRHAGDSPLLTAIADLACT
ncbi:MAG: hypothetical protein EA383_12370 [Spirochaetaceae bacterium]|nr:MAG: hypothetical protein EA383_12370 [Spirochaetaceae bacterium]